MTLSKIYVPKTKIDGVNVQSYTPFIKAKRKRYYKVCKVYNIGVPVLTENGTMGGESFACEASSEYNTTYVAYKVFTSSSYWRSASASSWWLSWYNPVAIGIESITIKNYSSGGLIRTYDIQVSDDNTEWSTVYSGESTASTSASWDIDLSEVTAIKKYWRLNIKTLSTGSYAYISQIILNNAFTQETVEVNKNYDYDYMTDNMENLEFMIGKKTEE